MSTHATTMQAHSPGSYSISLMIHGALVLAVALSAYVFTDTQKNKNTEVFEIVAGPGTNYMGTEAPAPSALDPINFPTPPVTPYTAPEPEPEPIVTPVHPSPVEVPPVAHDAIVVPPPKTKTKTPPKTESVKMTKADFDKLNAAKNKNQPSQKTAAPKPVKPITAPKISSNTKSLVQGVEGGTGSVEGAGGRALVAAQADQMGKYWAYIAQCIKEVHEKPENASSTLVVRVEYQVAASGAIGAVKIIRSSGNRAFDDSVIKAFRSVRNVWGPRPDGRSGAKVADFHMQEEE